MKGLHNVAGIIWAFKSPQDKQLGIKSGPIWSWNVIVRAHLVACTWEKAEGKLLYDYVIDSLSCVSFSIEIQYQVGKSKFTRQIDLKNSTNKRGKRRNKKERTKMVPMLLPLSANGKVLKALSRVVRDFRPDCRPATPHIPCSPKALSYFDYCMLIIYNFPLTICTWFTDHTIMRWISLSRGCCERKMIYNRHI